jgi:hypothetical protein
MWLGETKVMSRLWKVRRKRETKQRTLNIPRNMIVDMIMTYFVPFRSMNKNTFSGNTRKGNENKTRESAGRQPAKQLGIEVQTARHSGTQADKKPDTQV